MRTSNPALSDDALARAARDLGTETSAPAGVTIGSRFTVIGTIQRSAILLVLILAGGVVGWGSVDVVPGFTPDFPRWIIPLAIGLFGVSIATILKPNIARYTSPPWAVAEGVFLGAISRIYEVQFDGIVGQAVVGTTAVAALTLGAYRIELIRVTPRFQRNVVIATMGVMATYLVNLVMRAFGSDGIGFLHDSGPLGIGISILFIGIAAMNLALDFDLMEKGEARSWPPEMMWYAAFGLMLTLVWLYIEMLRLLAKLRN